MSRLPDTTHVISEQQQSVAGRVTSWFEAAAAAATGASGSAEDTWRAVASKVHNRCDAET